jgi:ATP-binding cassette, subfamily B, bacterial
MSDSTGATPDRDDLPHLLRTLAFTVRTAFGTQPWLTVCALSWTPIGWATGALLALWLKLLIDGAVEHDTRAVVVAVAAIVASEAVGWAVAVLGTRMGQTFRERAGVDLESELIRVSAGTDTVHHLELPAYVDKLDPLRKETWIVHWTLEALAETLGAVVQMTLTVILLASVHPALLLLPLFGIPTLLVGRASAVRERNVQERLGEPRRLQRHLVELGTNSSPGKEIRLFGLSGVLMSLSRTTWRYEHAERARATWMSAGWQAAAAAVFAAGFVGSLALVGQSVVAGNASVGDLALALVLAATISGHLGLVAQMFHWLVSCLAVGARMLWLVDRAEDEAAVRAELEPASVALPDELRSGIELDGVAFHYPGTSRPVLVNLTLTLAAGSVVAIVGDNGAGKTTLLKLLLGLYAPTAGAIRVDGTDLRGMDLAAWRSRCTGAFQDHARFEVTLREAVGLGDISRRDDPAAVEAAVAAAGAREFAEALPGGLDTQLGATWPDGTDLSSGQWQKVALARGLMRVDPLLTVLDEPTASLDAQTEDALFARYAAEARLRRRTGVTLLVSHRFSTVRSADHIVVLANGTVAEQGSHEQLVERGGTYAELYEIQARGYR